MHVLHLHDRLSERGGAEVYLRTLIEALASSHSQTLAVETVDPGVTSPCSLEQVPGLGSATAAPVNLEELFARVRPDVVHVHNVSNPTALEAAARHKALMTVHDHRSFCPGRGKWTAENTVCREAMTPAVCAPCFEQTARCEKMVTLTEARQRGMAGFHLHVLSDYMASELRAVGVEEKRLTRIPPAVRHLNASGSHTARDCILFVGRLSVAKGVDAAMEAWKRSGLTDPLVFAGTGRERSRVEAAGFHVTGWLSAADLEEWYQRALAVILPSRWQEPFGLVGIEALVRGIPVVAWESGGVSEWHPGGDLLVPWGDVEGLGKALRMAPGSAVPLLPDRSGRLLAERMTSLYRIVSQRCIP